MNPARRTDLSGRDLWRSAEWRDLSAYTGSASPWSSTTCPSRSWRARTHGVVGLGHQLLQLLTSSWCAIGGHAQREIGARIGSGATSRSCAVLHHAGIHFALAKRSRPRSHWIPDTHAMVCSVCAGRHYSDYICRYGAGPSRLQWLNTLQRTRTSLLYRLGRRACTALTNELSQ